jgi:hypothetical protein
MNAVEAVYGVERGGVRGTGDGPGTDQARPRPRRDGMAWPAVLDALEERTRRYAALIEDGEGAVPDDTPLVAEGPLPAELELRARVVLAETARLTDLAERRRDTARRALQYNQA